MANCDHNHQETRTGARRLTAAFVVISVFMVVEAVGGILSGSLALLADAAHMLTDALALGLAISANVIARRPADLRNHFGYHRAQVLAAFVNGIALMVLLIWIVIEACRRFFNPIDVDANMMITIAIIGLAANAVAFFILHDESTRNVNVRGAMLHVVSDLLGSVAAIIAALVIMFSAWTKIDPLLSLLVAGLIGRSAYKLIKETGHILLEGAPQDIDVETLARDVKAAAPGVVDIHDVRIWQLTPNQASLTLHAQVDNEDVAGEALDRIKSFLADRYAISQSTVQIEVGGNCPDCGENESATVIRRAAPEAAVQRARVERRDGATAAVFASQK